MENKIAEEKEDEDMISATYIGRGTESSVFLVRLKNISGDWENFALKKGNTRTKKEAQYYKQLWAPASQDARNLLCERHLLAELPICRLLKVTPKHGLLLPYYTHTHSAVR